MRGTRGKRTRPAGRVTKQALELPFLLLFSMCLSSACGPEEPKTPGRSDNQQSVAEYDVARDLWMRRGNPRNALEHALKALELDEDNAEAAHLVALLYLDFCRRDANECRIKEAERYTRMALDAYPKFREATNTLGVVLIHEHRYQEAVATLKPLTEDLLYQTPENAWGNLGLAYLEQGQLEEAIVALKRSVAAQPAFCVGHYRLGLAYEKKRDARAALEEFERALSAAPQCSGLQEAQLGRGRSLIQLGRSEEAKSALDDCVRLDKTTPSGRECQSLRGKIE